jgi:hypothetical protein
MEMIITKIIKKRTGTIRIFNEEAACGNCCPKRKPRKIEPKTK